MLSTARTVRKYTIAHARHCADISAQIKGPLVAFLGSLVCYGFYASHSSLPRTRDQVRKLSSGLDNYALRDQNTLTPTASIRSTQYAIHPLRLTPLYATTTLREV